MAIDSAGNPVSGVNIALTAHSLQYRKGEWIKGATSWVFPTNPATCANEDLDLDGVLSATDADLNHDSILQPGDVAVATPGQVTTGADGSADFQVIYGQDHAAWVRTQLTAKTTVQGTESSDTATFWLPMLAKYANNVNIDIPGRVSPYGVNTCGDTN
jgi:hypothetical protein